MQFAAFFSVKKSTFQWIEQISKSSLGGATIRAQMAEKISKYEKMGAKFVITINHVHFGHLQMKWNK